MYGVLRDTAISGVC